MAGEGEGAHRLIYANKENIKIKRNLGLKQKDRMACERVACKGVKGNY